jgi:uncharacterized protein YdeI (YjbR/CyaY-like superfamily)
LRILPSGDNDRIVAPRYFETPAAFRRWLEANHDRAAELLVGFRKVGSGKPSMTWKESVGEALCYGWIDGVRKRIDDDSYTIRFTPRRPGSIWSAVNIRRVGELEAAGRMMPAGLAVFRARNPERTNLYSFEARNPELGPELIEALKKNRAAWAYFQDEAPWYRRTVNHWVMSAKKEETRRARMQTLIADCAAGRRIKAVPAPRRKGPA